MLSDAEKLAKVKAIAEDAEGTASMDMEDPPCAITEILAVLNGTSCEECGNPGWLRLGQGVSDHYNHCPKDKEKV